MRHVSMLNLPADINHSSSNNVSIQLKTWLSSTADSFAAPVKILSGYFFFFKIQPNLMYLFLVPYNLPLVWSPMQLKVMSPLWLAWSPSVSLFNDENDSTGCYDPAKLHFTTGNSPRETFKPLLRLTLRVNVYAWLQVLVFTLQI